MCERPWDESSEQVWFHMGKQVEMENELWTAIAGDWGDWVRWPVYPLDNLCSITSVLPTGKGHKKMLHTVKR